MKMKGKFAVTFAVLALMALPVCAQQFPPQGDDLTSSLGSFKIQITPQFAAMFNGCPGYNNPILTSPTMYDPATKVGRSAALTDGSPADTGGVAVGAAGSAGNEGKPFAPPGVSRARGSRAPATLAWARAIS